MDSWLDESGIIVSIVSGVVGVIATVASLRRGPERMPESVTPRSTGAVYGRGAAAHAIGRAQVTSGLPTAGPTVSPGDPTPSGRPTVVPGAPAVVPGADRSDRTPTNLGWAWVCTVLFFYLGIPSLIYAYRSRAAYRRGDYAAGRRLRRVSRWLSHIGIAILLVTLLVDGILAATGHMSSS